MGLFNVHTVSNAYRSDYFQYLSEQWATDDNEFTGMWNRDVTGSATITRVNTDTDMPKVSLTVPASGTARLRSNYSFRATPSKFSNTAMEYHHDSSNQYANEMIIIQPDINELERVIAS